jgi:F-type H+-transporting ATPase subunit b
MTIDWWTLGLQAVNFLVLVWLLTRFLYRPVRRIIEQRKALVDEARNEAEKAKADAEAAHQRYEEERAKLPVERQEMLKKVHDELEEDRKNILGSAKGEAEKLLAAAKASIEDQRREALKGVKTDVATLAGVLAGRILGGSAVGSLNDVFLDRVEAEVDKLPEEERERLIKDLGEEGATLTVVTAGDLGSDDRCRWSDRLAKILGPGVKPDFKTDAGIIGGAELHFPHAVLRFTWADQLKAAEKELVGDGSDQ